MSDVLHTILDSLTEGFFMFWATLWALVVGFGLSGAVQSFVSRRDMQRLMGDHRPGTVARTSLLGAASSSCSYAATALAKSLFQRGGDFFAAMVFMFASTNLVLELGIILWLLIGWQFAAAEFVGGAIMIALFTVVGPRLIPQRWIDAARERLERGRIRTGEHEHGEQSDGELQGKPWRERLRSRAGWADAASYTMADLTMLRRELVIGYLIAGLLAVAVPASVWSAVFFSGHGFWTSVENVVVGPFIAFISFVCSIGNVPLAAALWKGGISFGGVVAFIFADLISLPLVIIYSKFYGRRLALRLFGVFWLVMSLAGLAVEGIFALLGLVPRTRPVEIAPTGFHWNYTTFLNIGALVLFAAIVWVARNKERFGGGVGYALDPVCGMQVEQGNAPATHAHEGSTYYFCCDRCAERFAAAPGRFTTRRDSGSAEDSQTALDPVCGMSVEPASAAAHRGLAGRDVWFCSTHCAQAFDEEPSRYLAPTS